MDLVEAITQGYSLRQVAQGLAGKRKLKEPPKRQRLTKDAETEKAKDNDGLFDIAAIRKQAGRTVVEGTDG